MAAVNMGLGEGEAPVFAEINMIPFIDVALVLLIIFMVLSPMLVQAGLPMDLPEASTAAPIEENKVEVSLAADGALMFDRQKTVIEKVSALTSDALGKKPGLLFVIKADAATRYERVITLADTLRQAGATRLAFGTAPVEKPFDDKKKPVETP